MDMVRTEAPADWRKPPETATPLHLQLLHQGSTQQSAIWAKYNILLQFKSEFNWRSLMVTMRNMGSEKGRKIYLIRPNTGALQASLGPKIDCGGLS